MRVRRRPRPHRRARRVGLGRRRDGARCARGRGARARSPRCSSPPARRRGVREAVRLGGQGAPRGSAGSRGSCRSWRSRGGSSTTCSPEAGSRRTRRPGRRIRRSRSSSSRSCSWRRPRGSSMRALRPALRPRPGRGGGLPAAPFLALAAALGRAGPAYRPARGLCRGVRRVLLRPGARRVTRRGRDREGLHRLRRRRAGLRLELGDAAAELPLPADEAGLWQSVGVVGGPNGEYADVMAVDAATLGSVIRWYPDWGARSASAPAWPRHG